VTRFPGALATLACCAFIGLAAGGHPNFEAAPKRLADLPLSPLWQSSSASSW